MKNYEFKDLYVASIIKITKDFYNRENKIPDCIETMGFAIVTKSHFFDDTFVDIFTTETYNVLSKNSKVGECVYVEARPFEAMFSSLISEELQSLKESVWTLHTLGNMLERMNANFPEFASSRLNPKEDEDDDIDISKMC